MIKIDIRQSNKCNGDWALFISFPYDNHIVSTIRNLPSRHWNKDTQEWEVPLNKLSKLLTELSQYEIGINTESTDMFVKKAVEATAIENFNFTTKPFEHQIEGFNYGLEHDRWLLGDEQGLGKTKQVIDIAVAKKALKGYKHCLIVCGVNGLKWNWQNEIKTHSSEHGWILGQRKKSKGWKIGSNKDKLEDLKNLKDNPNYFLITNVESLRDTAIATEVAKLCKNGTIGMVAIDEIHKCKNPTSQQGKGILKVLPDCRIAMTGTPLMNHPLDLYIILKWLGYEKHAFYAFKNHHCMFGGFGGYEIIGYKHLDELQEQLNEIMLRRRKSEVLDLPDKIYIDEYVEMTGKQEQVYKEVTAEIRMNIDKIKSASNPLAQLIRMRQATGYTGILSSTIQESAKLDRMEELVEEAVHNDQKVVIFSNWTQMTDIVCKRLKAYKPAVITGDTKDEERQAMVKAFQEDKNCKVIVGTIGAMGTGLTLTAGTVEIFLDEPWTMAAKDQAVDRCHRIGAKSNVTIYTLLAKDTIDERIHELVQKKGAMAEAIVDGNIVGNRSELVDFLLA
jgi:SNF2 family DNA or RNA helicase